MIILDTDALSHMQKGNPLGLSIEARLPTSADQVIQISAITVHEMLIGVVALVAKRKKERGDLISAFELFEQVIKYLAAWTDKILSYESRAERIYKAFPPRLRQELKEDARIAAVALVQGATIWTCNVRDYARVPGLILVDARTGLKVP